MLADDFPDQPTFSNFAYSHAKSMRVEPSICSAVLLKRRFMPTLSRQTNVLLLQVVEQIADGVLLTDCHGFIEYVNPAFERMTGFSAEEVRGKTPRILKSGLQDAAF